MLKTVDRKNCSRWKKVPDIASCKNPPSTPLSACNLSPWTPSSSAKMLRPTATPSRMVAGTRRKGQGLVIKSKRYSYSKPKSNSGPSALKNLRFGNTTYVTTTPRVVLAALGGGIVDAATQRGNIQVVVRVRPPNEREMGPARKLVVQAIDRNLVIFDPKEDSMEFYFHGVKQKSCRDFLKKPNKDLKFAFDGVYGPHDSNEELFEGTIKTTIDTLLSGYNCSVFAYGATGSGKTFTMLGNSNQIHGLTFLTVAELYNRLESLHQEYEPEIAISYLEVYNETVRDLLGKSGSLNVCEDGNSIIIPNLTRHRPKDAFEILELLKHGNSVRSQHPTDHNAESSRSHAVFQVFVKMRGRYKDVNNDFKAAKLVMVDLAGSERGSATGCAGARFREGASINKSLLALGNCINALADGKKHIPYRDSKLTRILKDALGGNCKTVMIANVSPSDLSYDDTYNTLSYADRAKRIKFNLKKNMLTVRARVSQYNQVFDEMRDEIGVLKKTIENQKKSCRCDVVKRDVSTETEEIQKSRSGSFAISDTSCYSTGTAYFTANSTESSEIGVYNYDGNKTVLIDSNNILDTEMYTGEQKSVLGPNGDQTIVIESKENYVPHRHDSSFILDSIEKNSNELKMFPFTHLKSLLDERVMLQTQYNELSASLRDIDWKLKCKSSRFETAKALVNKDYGEGNRGIDRMKKQLDGLKGKKKSQVSKLDHLKVQVDRIAVQISEAESLFCNTSIRSEYVQLKKKEAELITMSRTQHADQEMVKCVFDELLKTEALLNRSLKQLKASHYLLRGLGHTTTEDDDNFFELMTEIDCTKIHFVDGNSSDTKPSKLSPYLYNIGSCSLNESSGDDIISSTSGE